MTILLNAAMPLAQKSGPPANRWVMLMSMLASLVEQMPEASVRVVAFDTAQQRELFRKDDFTAADINDVAHVSNARQRWAVDYQVLQNPSGGWDLLRDLENKELHATTPSDTVIFLGVPQARFGKMPPGTPGTQSAPRFSYLKYEAPLVPLAVLSRPPGASDQPDLVEQSVRHLKGKIFVVSSPADFSKALTTIER